VEVEDDVDEEDNVHNGVDHNHHHRIIVDGPVIKTWVHTSLASKSYMVHLSVA